jgi:hypothetical protein
MHGAQPGKYQNFFSVTESKPRLAGPHTSISARLVFGSAPAWQFLLYAAMIASGVEVVLLAAVWRNAGAYCMIRGWFACSSSWL